MKKTQMEFSWNIATNKLFLEIHLKYFFKCFQSAYLHSSLTLAFNLFRKVCEPFKNSEKKIEEKTFKGSQY